VDQPLAERIRPKNLDEIVGQRHLLEKDAVFRRIIESGEIRNMIFYGPSGVGKTTVASIIAAKTHRTLYKLNGTTALTADIKSVIRSRFAGGAGRSTSVSRRDTVF